MGLTKVTTKLSNFSDLNRFYETLFLLDTGATDSLTSAAELKKIG